jgi:aromatic cluster surface protein
MKRKIVSIFTFCICVIVALLITSSLRVDASSDENSNYSANYYLVLNESNIDFTLYNQDYLNDLINEVFTTLDENPNANLLYNYSVSQDLANQIKDFYLSYYNCNINKNVNNGTRY